MSNQNSNAQLCEKFAKVQRTLEDAEAELRSKYDESKEDSAHQTLYGVCAALANGANDMLDNVQQLLTITQETTK